MCNCPILVKFDNKYHPKFVYGMGNPVPYTYVKKHGKEYKLPKHFCPLPLGFNSHYLSASFFNLPSFVRVPDAAAVAAALADDPLSLPQQRKSGLYHLFKIDTPESSCLAMYIPCGRCVDCINSRVNAWTFRLQRDMENTENLNAYFLTLTYRQQSLPVDGYCSPRLQSQYNQTLADLRHSYGKLRVRHLRRLAAIRSLYRSMDDTTLIHNDAGLINYTDFQLFIKRFRSLLKRWYDVDIKYFVCAEYGKDTFRPHFHCLIWFSGNIQTRNGYNFTGYLRGKDTLMSRYVKKTRRVPSLGSSVFRYLAFNCYGLCERQAFVCESVRSSGGSSRYICKYMSKNLLFMSNKMREQKNVIACPPVYRRSQYLAKNYAQKFAAAICSQEKPFESYKVRYTNKSGQSCEYLQNLPKQVYSMASDFLLPQKPLTDDSICSRAKWLTPRLHRYFAVRDNIDFEKKSKDVERSLRLSNLQMLKIYE